MDEPTFVEHDGARILIVDFAACAGRALQKRVVAAERFIRSQPPASLLILARVGGVEFSAESTKLLLDHVIGNAPFSRATAVVGLGYLAKAVPIANRLTGRDLNSFDEEIDALDWLAAHDHPVVETDHAVYWIEHRGERILVMDFGGCDEAELRRRVEKAASIIRREPPRSVIALNYLHAFPYGRESNTIMMDYVRGNRPHMIAAAVVGLEYMKPAIAVMNRFTGRNIRTFDDEEAAKDWLVSEKDRFRSAGSHRKP